MRGEGPPFPAGRVRFTVIVRQLHPFHHGNVEGTAAFTAPASSTVGGVGAELTVMGAHGGGYLPVHGGQVIKLIHHGDVDSGGTGSAVAAVGALA